MLPEKNFSAKSSIDKELLKSADWKAAKERSDAAAADRVIDQLWSEKKFEAVKAKSEDPANVVFITVPSTSGTNVFPMRLAGRLAKEFNGSWLNGDEYFSAVHRRQSKYIPRLQRAFHRREYVPEDLGSLKQETAGRSVFVVDDIMTTGGSAAVFCQSLKDQGVQVESVIALMGDHRLSIDRKTIERLDAALQKSGLPFEGEEVAARLTRVEAGGLIVTINSARSEDAKQRLAGNLYGLLDQRAFADLARAPAAERHPGAQGPDPGHAKASEAIQDRPIRGSTEGRVGDQREPAKAQRYQITVEARTSGRKYTETVSVDPKLSGDAVRGLLGTKASELSAKVAAKHDIKSVEDLRVTVAPLGAEKTIARERAIDRLK